MRVQALGSVSRGMSSSRAQEQLRVQKDPKPLKSKNTKYINKHIYIYLSIYIYIYLFIHLCIYVCPTSQLLSSLNRLSNESKQPPSLFATCNSGHGVFSEQARLKPIAAYDSET